MTSALPSGAVTGVRLGGGACARFFGGINSSCEAKKIEFGALKNGQQKRHLLLNTLDSRHSIMRKNALRILSALAVTCLICASATDFVKLLLLNETEEYT